ncbi:hypothetical protein N7495_002373 [Penicillium taxi]|uniref:uncharacterized protein n=1 Tax=Penicillium taxi TaxID=168475 RepID=UPI002545007C|nr:uncharacterized protein N7495_002373 [Penicillium taxi]KAJ5901845.1 hypothetical protein N7495_002373 [Penicillium taxi]
MSCPELPDESYSSDYSDFATDEEELLTELLTQVSKRAIESGSLPTTLTRQISSQENTSTSIELTDIESPRPSVLTAHIVDIEDGIEGTPSSRLPKVLGREKPRSLWRQSSQHSWLGQPNPHNTLSRDPSNSANYTNSSGFEHPSSTEGRERERERCTIREGEWTQNTQALPTEDPRSPVERFRRPPNKAFSVTDLVSPAWCELQYWYTLTKHGRKRRTAAMKKGSSVHKSLEDEIYTTVPVDITTKEDAWALRIWNVIQGLRLLREYGITRELEVWGVIDGELVNGVIDQLSYECPDLELEATASGFYADAASSRDALPEYQMSLSDFLLSESQGGIKLSDLGKQEKLEDVDPQESIQESAPDLYALPRIYITDDKTKANRSLPTVKSTGFRPTLLQLHLYYHMLNRLITSDDVTMDILAARYHLNQHRPFTDAFISEVGGLNDEFFDACSSPQADWQDISDSQDLNTSSPDPKIPSSPLKASQDSTTILVDNGNLSSLWSYMKDQLRLTFIPSMSESRDIAPSIPAPTQPTMLEEYTTLLSPVLTARYLSSAASADTQSRLLGSRSFLFDPNNMSSYVNDQMEWWRGQRDPRGVNIADAWKCRICDFQDDCSWRQERELQYLRRNRV